MNGVQRAAYDAARSSARSDRDVAAAELQALTGRAAELRADADAAHAALLEAQRVERERSAELADQLEVLRAVEEDLAAAGARLQAARAEMERLRRATEAVRRTGPLPIGPPASPAAAPAQTSPGKS